MLVQIEEEERAIRAIPFVTTLSFVRAIKGKAEGWRVTLTCFACREYNSCEKKQEASVHISGERPTRLACLQELRKRLEEHHGNCAEALAKKAATKFTVTTSSGIRDGDARVDEIMTRELEKAKPDKWGYVQTRESQVGRPQVRGVQGGALWER